MTKYAQSGMTLLESLIALSVFSVVLWAAMANYSTALSSLYGARLFSDVQSIRFAIIELHHGQTGYGTEDLAPMLAQSKRMPFTVFEDSGGLRSLDGSQVFVYGLNDRFVIELLGTSKAICMQLMGRLSGDHWLNFSAASLTPVLSAAQLISNDSMPLSNDELLNVCTGDSMFIALQVR